MRKIVANFFISLDGVVERPDQWHFPYFNDEMGEVVGGGMASSDTMLLGRKTYEEFASYWPQQTEPPADHMNGVRKVVVSSTLERADWQNSTLIRGGANLAEELTALKGQPGKDISTVGSATLVRALIREGLLDELQLLLHPIVVGTGARLFDGSLDKVPLKLVASRTFSTGVLHLTYAPAGA
jgi:dihydrofolate reductase